MKTWIWRMAPPGVFLAALVLVLEFVVRAGGVAPYILPAPSQVAHAFSEFYPELQTAFGATFTATLIGLGISILLGQGLALGLSVSPFLRRALFPIAVFFQTVPIIAIAPLLVIWFGFGQPTVRASAAIVAFFPILSNALVGLQSTSRESLELFQILGATKFQTLLRLRIPSGLRATLAGLRVAAGLAVVGALVGEFVGGGGLGSLIDSARTQQRVDLVFACVVSSALLGLIFVAAVALLERLILSWRPFFESN